MTEGATKLNVQLMLSAVRSAVATGHPVVVRADDTVVLGDGSQYQLSEEIPSYAIVGCDLKNYSGLSDVEQYVFGAVLEARIGEALKAAGLLHGDVCGVSGTGDGALIAFPETALTQALSFALHLFEAGKKSIIGHDGRTRGLRVAMTCGPCVFRTDRDQHIDMQGYGLIETARILGFDKETHFLVSAALWQRWAKHRSVAVFGDAYLTGELRRSTTPFRGKGKPGDRQRLAFYNVWGQFAAVGSDSFTVGSESDEGIVGVERRRVASERLRRSRSSPRLHPAGA